MKEGVHRIFLSTEDRHEHVQINLGPNVGDITIECKPPRRGQFTFNYIEAHEDSEDGALLMRIRGSLVSRTISFARTIGL